LLFPILLLVFFYFFLIVPEQKKQKKAKQLIESLGIGSSIVTRGGIYGKIVDMNGDVVTIVTGPDDVKINISRFSVSQVIKNEEPERNESEVSYSENEAAAETNELEDAGTAEEKNE
jgi:preprotein translocase subunit YajC